VRNGFHRRALTKAVGILGDEDRVREMLDAPRAAFHRWRAGEEAIPQPYFGMLLDFLADMESGINILTSVDETRSQRTR
jgi:hypothetical protein